MFEDFKKKIAEEVDDFLKIGSAQGAEDLAATTGHEFYAKQAPLYYVGDLCSELVVVHLHPGKVEQTEQMRPYETGKQYIEYVENFGKLTYGPPPQPRHNAGFDWAQLQFLQPFGFLDFEAGSGRDSECRNLQKVMDNKLQLELIPYACSNFSRGKRTVLGPHFERVLDIIGRVKRRNVIFCGSVFGSLALKIKESSDIVEAPIALTNRNHQPAPPARAATFSWQQNGCEVRALIAHTYLRTRLPLGQYGQACANLFHSRFG